MTQQYDTAIHESPKFFITLHPNTFKTREDFKLGYITKYFQHNANSTQHTLEEILQLSAQGRCYMPSFVECEDGNYHFVASKLILIDVDDDHCVTDPRQVLEQLKDVCVGLFFTGSHGIKGNRYRLLFASDQSIRDAHEYTEITKLLINKLQQIGVPADANAQEPTQRVRTAMNGYILNNPSARLNVEEYKEEVAKKVEKERAARAKNVVNMVKNREIWTVEELTDRAKAIGYVSEHKEWRELGYALKSYVLEGHITDAEGYEIFSLLCGGNDETEFWDKKLKPRGAGNGGITIGTFIGKSEIAGFKRNFRFYHAINRNFSAKYNIETAKFDKYISVDFAKDVLEQGGKTLIKAPTGSGKTSNFIDAALQLQKEHPSRYYIVAVPTRMITQQSAVDRDIIAITGDTKDMFKLVKAHHDAGKRVIAVTYDMAAIITDLIKQINPFSSFSYIIDEFHHFTHSYGFRRAAIDSLFALNQHAKAYIGLSGTIDDILREKFDREIHVSTNYENAPCAMWGAITYRRKVDEEPQLIQLIKQKVQNGKKLLVFIQSFKMIKRVRDVLRKSGVIVNTITADGKNNNAAYNSIAKDAAFPNGVQVVLTTSVIADGVNINNVKKGENGELVADMSYECIVVTSVNSPNYNVSLVRQMSNRFRAKYGAFYVFMLRPLNTTEYSYNIDKAHDYEISLANNALDLIKEEFAGRGNSQLFKGGIIEKRFDIRPDENEQFLYNELLIRHNVSNEKSDFHAKYRVQFIEALTKLMGTAPAETVNISDYLESNQVNYNDVIELVAESIEAEKLDEKERAANVEMNYTPIIHRAYVEENEAVLREFKKVANKHHFHALQELAPLTDYQTSLQLVKQVTKSNQRRAFINSVESVLYLYYYSQIDRKSPTYEAFLELAKHAKQPMTNAELDEIIASISKKYKRSKKVDVKKIAERYFYHEKTRSEKERFVTLHVLQPEHIVQTFGVDEVQLKKAMNKVAENMSTIKKIVLKKMLQMEA